MKKKTIALIGVSLLTLALAVVAVITALKLREIGTQPIAPTAPESRPEAAETGLILVDQMRYSPSDVTVPPGQEMTVVNNDIVDHAVTATPSAIFDTGTISADGGTATFNAPTDPGLYRFFDPNFPDVAELRGTINVTEAVSQVPVTLQPVCLASFNVQALVCDEECSDDSQCGGSLVCDDASGRCRNAECSEEASCGCEEEQVVCNEVCTNDDQCEGDLVCDDVSGRCRETSCLDDESCECPQESPSPSPSASPSPSPSAPPSETPTPTPTPSPVPGCYESCVVDADCTGSLICSGGLCVNATCPSESDCLCNVGGPPPDEVEEVQLPEAGISLPTIGLLSAGVVTMLLGVLALLL